jgi:hypothetical protein
MKLVLYLILFPLLSFSQNKTDKIIDGGRLLLDVFKEIKTTKTPSINTETQPRTDATKGASSKTFCLYNPTENRITVEVSSLSGGNIITVVCNSTIPPKDSTCCVNLRSGLYHIKIVQANTTPNVVLKEADFNYDAEQGKSINIK